MNYTLPPDYEERVYAGVLGKLIGVYLGRPFEQWSHEAISKRWGEIRRYVHEDVKVPLIVTDDDITGTFTFLRALDDHGMGADITAREIGQTWLNYIAENRHILWWGGYGQSTEHTAYLRLKAGTEAPLSGSIELNGRAVAEEIGSQIFIDGWAMVSPGQPEQAAKLATQASLVSHDGEAVHGAVVIAVMEALAFFQHDIDELIDSALKFIPDDCEIAKLIDDLREWHKADADWRTSLGRLQEKWGYARYGTNCPMVSNHGVIILALLYGEGDFDRSMMIVNTSGYDTDCNAGNLGCLLGIRNGLSTFQSGYDWRTPVNDRLYLPAADGHHGITDATRVAMEIANLGRRLAGASSRHPKDGARYHFDLPGATHSFAPSDLSPLGLRLQSIPGGLRIGVLAPGQRADAEVPTFLPPDALEMKAYSVTATPTLYPCQIVTAEGVASPGNRGSVKVKLFVRAYGSDCTLKLFEGPEETVSTDGRFLLKWSVPETGGYPIAKAGVALDGKEADSIDLHRMDWSGAPSLVLDCPKTSNGNVPAWKLWQSTFVENIDHFNGSGEFPFDIIRNTGTGLIHTGSADWKDYSVSAEITPWLADQFGLLARVQGLTRYYALLASRDQTLRLVCMKHVSTVLGEYEWPWSIRKPIAMKLSVRGNKITAYADGKQIFEVEDDGLTYGGVGLVVSDGRVQSGPIRVQAFGD